MARVLSKGGSAPLPLASARIEVRLPSAHYHAAIILVTAAGIVHYLKDLTSNDGRSSNEDWLSACVVFDLDLAAVPQAAERIVVVTQLAYEETTVPRASDFMFIVQKKGGSEIVRFEPTSIPAGAIMVLAEISRKGETWTVRAVGEGFTAGLAGISIGSHVFAQEAVAVDRTPTEAPRGIDQSWQSDLGELEPALSKGRPVRLTPAAAQWARVSAVIHCTNQYQLDLFDPACILYDSQGNVLENIWRARSKGARGAIVIRQPTEVSGAALGAIDVDLGAMHPQVHAMIVVINSLRNTPLALGSESYCQLSDQLTGRDLLRFPVPDSPIHTGLIVCKIQLDSAGWSLTRICEFQDGKTVRAMVGPARQFL